MIIIQTHVPYPPLVQFHSLFNDNLTKKNLQSPANHIKNKRKLTSGLLLFKVYQNHLPNITQSPSGSLTEECNCLATGINVFSRLLSQFLLLFLEFTNHFYHDTDHYVKMLITLKSIYRIPVFCISLSYKMSVPLQ